MAVASFSFLSLSLLRSRLKHGHQSKGKLARWNGEVKQCRENRIRVVAMALGSRPGISHDRRDRAGKFFLRIFPSGNRWPRGNQITVFFFHFGEGVQ
uniref:Putative secreted protein n=1 Tax=Anopheles darlingi TaxID=43151 RepID=A0A2M4DDU7_ANODA